MRLHIETRLPVVSGRQLTPYKFPEDRDHGNGAGVPISFLGTVGAELGEPYAIVFTNAAADRVEVRFTIDGLDILTGNPADLSTSGPRMLVEAYSTVKLEAWPESSTGGARFVFAPDGMAVADYRPAESPKGIIAAAVFVESAHRAPNIMRSFSPQSFGGDAMRGATKGGDFSGSLESFGESSSPASFGATRGGSPAKGVGTGAGEYVAQELRTT